VLRTLAKLLFETFRQLKLHVAQSTARARAGRAPSAKPKHLGRSNTGANLHRGPRIRRDSCGGQTLAD
jgi:hypothetical protein